MQKPHLVVLVGTVGSGKSTCMRLLYLRLRRKGLKVKTASLKTGHLLAFILEVLLAKMLVSKGKDVYPIRALIEEKPHLFRRIFKLWLILDLISITIKFLISVYLPLKLGYIVIVEEYIPATISDYIYLSKLMKPPLKMDSLSIGYLLRMANLCVSMKTIFLDAESDELVRRWKVRGSPNEREDYIQMQRSLLLCISKRLSSKFLYVNTKIMLPNELIRISESML